MRELEKEIEKPEFWSDKTRAQDILKQLSFHRKKIQPWQSLKEKIQDALSLVELSDGDLSLEKDVLKEAEAVFGEFETLKLQSLLSGKYDGASCILSIHAGAGGTEACDWTDMLLRMYTRYCEKEGYGADLVDFTPGDEAGKRSATLVVEGAYAYGKLKAEKGVHRLVRISPFDANKRRHTTFAAVDVVPEIEEDVNVEIKDEDLKIDTFRASGAGGQHVNKTSSAVRVTHVPTGIIVSCQSERSQHRNRDVAMKILKSRLLDRLLAEKKEKVEELRGEVKEIAWGNQIRSYVFQPYTMVKDHRTGVETGNVQKVMDGDIEEFIWEYLKKPGNSR